MYKIKHTPDEFIVIEQNAIIPKKKGRYNYCRLIKANMNTLDAIRDIAKVLHIPDKRIGFAGNKDKIARTEQYITIDSKHNINIDKENYSVTSLGYLDEPLTLGMLDSNTFKIIIRGLDKAPERIMEIPNYFGEQRFSENNALIGKHIITRNYDKAVEELKAQNANITMCPNAMQVLQTIPRRDLRLFVHSYQSLLWNRTTKRLIEQGIKVEKVPIIGFGSRFSEPTKKIIGEILQEEEITQRNFINRQIPFLSSEGDERDMFITIKDLSISEPKNDETNSNKKKVKVSFTLPRGSYATVVISFLCGRQELLARHS